MKVVSLEQVSDEFADLVKDVLADFFDFARLWTHPLLYYAHREYAEWIEYPNLTRLPHDIAYPS